jgi:pilus assembly protein Flp/PilA
LFGQARLTLAVVGAQGMSEFFRKLLRDERAASAVEYGLILAMIVLAMLTALGNFANESSAMWSNVHQRSANAIQGSAG